MVPLYPYEKLCAAPHRSAQARTCFPVFLQDPLTVLVNIPIKEGVEFGPQSTYRSHYLSQENKVATKSNNMPGETVPEKSEQAMVEGILEGSPDAVGVAVIRLDCGCRKMAAVNAQGEPASKVIMYRDSAESICDLCKADQGVFTRVIRQFISWKKPEPDHATQQMIKRKVFGS